VAIIRKRVWLAVVCAALASCAAANRSGSPAVTDSPAIIDSQFCRAGPGEVCAAVDRAVDHDPLSGVLVSLVGPSGNVIASSRTDRRGIALLKLPDENVAIKYVIAEPVPTVIVGVRWYPNVRQYYIESCGGSIP
jgi:hypothetical protein